MQPRKTEVEDIQLNAKVADVLREISELYAIKQEYFKSRAYQKVSQRIESLTDDIEEVYESGKLQEIQGIGKGIAAVIGEYLSTGKSSRLKTLQAELPTGALELIRLEGIGPKTALRLHKELGITSIKQFEEALHSGKIADLKGFGRKSEERLLKVLKDQPHGKKRYLLGAILPIIRETEDYLMKFDSKIKVNMAGSARRMKETVGDIDILVACKDSKGMAEHFVSMPQVHRIVSQGSSRSTIIIKGGLQIDLRIVKLSSFGSACQYFTGSKEHNIKLRSLAAQLGYKLNEYGLFKRKTGTRIAGKTETSIYQTLDLEYIEPELRENRGEIEGARSGSLPKLIKYGEVKGDLHVHSNWSDGAGSLEEIAEFAQKRGLEYIAICDHSKALGIARGLNEERLRKQMFEIEHLNRRFENFRLLRGIEVDIMSDGTLDLPNRILKDLDIVVASIHRGFKGSEEKLTKRIVSTVHNEHVNIIGHPSGRIIQRRPPYPLRFEEIFEIAADQKVAMEINAFPDRLDLNDVNCKSAEEHGAKLAIGTDAHAPAQINYLELGVAVARRGWLEPHDIINTKSFKDLL
ncbi:MAG: DNA polymerase/3'-5' exonuclease PolX [Candidatus Bathyarchaeota archaeon]|nr:MAG: DNA polymerase/3'-5' exonuclease PolX [Candidatus Bathyarchaeota archaeon]